MKAYKHPDLREIVLETMMQALSDPCRLTIVRTLAQHPSSELCCNEIPLNVSKATRSHHFDVLREAGVIRTRSEGTRCMTSLRAEELNHRFPGLLKLIIRQP